MPPAPRRYRAQLETEDGIAAPANPSAAAIVAPRSAPARARAAAARLNTTLASIRGLALAPAMLPPAGPWEDLPVPPPVVLPALAEGSAEARQSLAALQEAARNLEAAGQQSWSRRSLVGGSFALTAAQLPVL